MGKKKTQKTKELSVAIAEAQSAGDARIQQQTQHESQLQSPRRRGRPRKIFVKNESEEENKGQAADEAEQSEVGTIGVEYKSLSKRARTCERHELEKSSGHKQDKDKVQEESEPKSLDVAKKEGTVAGAKEDTKREPSSSRAKRKSKPRKSSSK